MQCAFKWGPRHRNRIGIAQFAPLRCLDHWAAQEHRLDQR
jgi:hypothetical protein